MRFHFRRLERRAVWAPTRTACCIVLCVLAMLALVACRSTARELPDLLLERTSSALGWCVAGPCCPAGTTLQCPGVDSETCSCGTGTYVPADTSDEKLARGSLATEKMLCMSAPARPGARVELRGCTDPPGDSVVFDVATGAIRLASDRSKCMSLTLGDAVKGDVGLVVSSCNGSPTQRFFFGAVELRAHDICLSKLKDSDEKFVGAACDGAARQRFVFTADGEVRDASDRCLTLGDDDKPRAASCTRSTRQRWTLAGKGILASRAVPLCVVPPLSIGQPPRVYRCEQVAYRDDLGFNIRGDLRIASPDDSTVKCVTAAAGLAAGKRLSLKSCASVAPQVWRWTGARDLADVPFPQVAIELALADGAGFARKGDGSVWSWGYNDRGELGPGSLVKVPRGPSPIAGLEGVRQVVAGARHACALDAQSVACWGAGDSLQLGETRRDSINLTRFGKDLGDAVSLAAGATFTCALRKAGSVACWGTMRFARGAIHEMKGVTEVMTGAVQIAAGSNHVCALDAKGHVKCLGTNTWGTIGRDEPTPYEKTLAKEVPLRAAALRIDAGGDATCAYLADGATVCWGSNGRGSFATGAGEPMHLFVPSPMSSLSNIASLALGDGHSCGITSERHLECWGNNFHGELGDGTTTERTHAARVTAIPDALAVAVSREHKPFWTCASRIDGTVSCWGGGAGKLLPSPMKLSTESPVH
jgi:Regulator of chromosome condensation (RCC1) repeat/Ricin-type beta-trefoil lectin domain